MSTSSMPRSEPIAIVGMGCRFPGGVMDPAGFWKLLREGGDAITEIPADRIDLGHYFDERAATAGRIMTRWGGFLQGIDEFDADFFGISPREAERLDPQQRLMLETAWEALEDAGLDTARLDGSNTAVFVGQWLSDFEARLFADAEGVDFYMTTGSGRYATSGRLSYMLGLRGPSLTLDTACSSSLAAVHLAVRSIRSGESDLAIAGGVNVILQPHISIAYSQSRMMAPDGHCKFGDAGGDGYVRSEGAGLVVLKSLQRALDDGDRIYAVIRGSAINNDGRSSGSMGTPSRVGQEELLRSAYRDAGVAPSRVGYVEAHGTGTRAGDPVELGALSAVLGDDRPPAHRAVVGSVKTNIGHTEGAAGVAGLIKAALALHHQHIPQSLHCKVLNPAIPWADMPVAVAQEAAPWPRGAEARVAGVSAFGIAGTNAHVVLEDAPAQPQAAVVPTRAHALLALSARSAAALKALAGRYADLLENAADAGFHDICWSAATRRTALEYRAVFVADSRTAMGAGLRRYMAGEAAAAEGLVHDRAAPGKLAFVMPGQGAQWHGMARELMRDEPVFRAALEQCDAAARPWLDVSLIAQLRAEPGSPGYRLDDIDVIQPVLVSLALAYAAWWRSLGVQPDAVVGHSMGEVGAACVAGVLSLDQAMQIICRRSQLMKRTSGQGAMALVDLSMQEAQARIRGREDHVAVAVSNSPRSSVISGEPAAVQQVMAELERDSVFCRLVKVDVASHSPQMQPLADELAVELTGLLPGEARVPIHSTVLGRRAEGREFGGAYWASNLRQPVRFAETVGHMLDAGVTHFVELGPHPVLLPSVQQTAQASGHAVHAGACGRRDEPEQPSLLTAFGALWAAGYPVDWYRLMPEGGRAVDLPHYPWQRERHWVDAADRPAAQGAARPALQRPDEESLGWLHQFTWQAADASPPSGAVAAPWLVAGDDEADARAVVAALTGLGASAVACTLERLGTTLASGDAQQVLLLAPGDDSAAFLPVRAVQAVLAAHASARLWFATCGAQSVHAGSRVSVPQAALWGSARVLAEEHPELWGGLVDRDPAADAEEGALALAQHLLAADGEDQVALRGLYRFVLRMAAVDRRKPTPMVAWRPDASYLITGGLGDIGLKIADTLVRRGARRLVLLGRTALPPRPSWSTLDAHSNVGRRVAAVRALEALGASVHLATVDVGDEVQLCRFLDAYAAEGWPPIRGVIHAAGSFDNRLASAMDRTAFDAVLAPKLRGAQLLDRLLPDLDVFVLFSSTGAFLAQAGQANYAAANAGLDALALDRRARGLPALSIAWGVWAGTGLVRDEAGQRNVAEMNRQGIQAFSAERGLALFDWLSGGADATLAVLPVDWAQFRRARAGRRDTLFRELLAGASAEPVSGAALGDQLLAAAPAERRQLMESVVKDAVGKVLKIAPARLDPRKALGAMGLNSLMAMELRNRLEAALGRSLSATLAWNYPTVEAMAAFLAGNDAVEATVAATGPALTEPLLQVAGLSDDEAALALRGTRKRGVR
jgi:phthiocerol/phenolphthiocerol synthesis type-I polyketide synthase B